MHLLVVGVLVGALFAFVVQIAPPPACQFIAAWSPHLDSPLVPDNLAAANDRRALAAGGYFASDSFDYEASLSSSLLRRQLEATSADTDAPLVVYLSALATTDDSGQLVLMTKDYAPLSQTSAGIRLEEVLQLLAANPAEHKLLLLDITTTINVGPVGLFPEEISKLAVDRLQQVADPGRLTIISSGQRQYAQILPGTGRTAFGYFFEQGISGLADGFNATGISDGRVSARELAAYVTDRVDLWSQQFATTRQTSVLVGEADDFVLTMADRKSQPPLLYHAKVEDYPAWLREAWELRQQCVEAGMLHSHPLLARRVDETVLTMERRWRYCVDSQSLEAYWQATRAPVERLRDKLATTGEIPISLGRYAVQHPVDTTTALTTWRVYFAGLDKAATVADPAARLKLETELKTTLAAQLKELTPQAAQLGLCDALTNTTLPLAICLPASRDYLVEQEGETSTIETTAICELAGLVGNNPPLLDDDARLVLQVIIHGERASGLPLAEPYISSLLTTANQHRLAGEVMMLNPGYGPVDQARSELNAALSLYRQAEQLQQIASHAVAVRDRAYAELPAMLPMVREYADLRPTWQECTSLSKRLYGLLDSTNTDNFAKQSSMVEQLACAVERHLAKLQAPRSEDRVDALIAELKLGHLEKRSQAGALLDTPLITLTHRLALLQALEQADSVVGSQLEKMARQAYRESGPLRGDASNLLDPLAAAALREAEYTVHLGEMAGMDMQPISEFIADKDTLAGSDQRNVASLLAEAYGKACGLQDQQSLDALDAVARILPGGYQQGVFAEAQFEPSSKLYAAVRLEWRDREQDRLLTAARNPLPKGLYTIAATRLMGNHLPSRPTLSIAGQDCCSELTEQHPAAMAKLLVSGTEQQPTVEVLSPTAAVECDVSQRAESDGCHVDLALSIPLSATHNDRVSTLGVLVRVDQGDTTQFQKLQLPGVSLCPPVEAWVDIAGVKQSLDEQIDIPCAAGPLPMDVILRNRSAVEQQVNLELKCGATFVNTVKLAPGQEVSALFGTTASGSTDTQPVDTLHLAVQSDQAGSPLFERNSRLVVSPPEDYLEFGTGWIERADGNWRLEIPVRRAAGAPQTVSVELQPVSSLGTLPIAIAGGQLAATLSADHPEETLTALFVADDLSSIAPTLQWSAKVNGVDRTFTLATVALDNAQAAKLVPLKQATIAIACPSIMRSGTPLKFATQVQAASRHSSIEGRLVPLSTTVGGDAEIVELAEARPPQITVTPSKEKGHLQITSTVGDAAGQFETLGLVGHYRLETVLLDARQQVAARKSCEVVFDDTPPQISSVSPQATPVVAGSTATFEVTTSDDLSGVDTVSLFIGLPQQGEVPKDAKLVTAHRNPQWPDTWVAQVPLPAGAPATVVTAMAVNGVGQPSFNSLSLKLKDAAQAKFGQIAGQVTEGGRLQAQLQVELRSPNKAVVAKSVTDSKGVFHFQQVKPGDYLLWCTKHQSQRTGSTPITVKENATSNAALQLSL